MKTTEMLKKMDSRKEKIQFIFHRYPRIVSHMIADSLGYFTPHSAAGAVLAAIEDRPFSCEYYSDCARRYGEMYDHDNLRRVTKEILSQSIKFRHHHKGAMSSYKSALMLVNDKHRDERMLLASWF